ncbi:MAG: polymer-forming cytoskeletal protein [Bacteroidota bacterium]|nr:polymer-forming cytoskeletal protein [Bacteroidota bacterium]
MLKKNNDNGARRAIEPGPNSTNQIVAGTTMSGNLETNNDIRFDGNLKGDLKCTSKVVQGASSRIEGNMYCNNAIIEGTVVGNVVVDDILTLKATARIMGDIITKKLVIEAGADFNGSCKMSTNGSSGSKEN